MWVPICNTVMLKKPSSAFARLLVCMNSKGTSPFKVPQMFTVILISGSQECSHAIQAELLRSVICIDSSLEFRNLAFLSLIPCTGSALRIPQTRGLCLSQQLRPLLSSFKDFLEVASTHGPQQVEPSAWCLTFYGLCASSRDQSLGTSLTFTWM